MAQLLTVLTLILALLGLSGCSPRFRRGAAASGNSESVGASTKTTTTTSATAGFFDTRSITPDMDVEYIGQFETALRPDQNHFRMARANAQENATLHLNSSNAGVEFRITICAQPMIPGPVVFRAGSLFYSNDGPSDNVILEFNNAEYLSGTTEENFKGGQGWNEFKEFRFAEDILPLGAGNHTVVVTVKTDQWGVDLDALTFIAKNQNPNIMLLCSAELVETAKP